MDYTRENWQMLSLALRKNFLNYVSYKLAQQDLRSNFIPMVKSHASFTHAALPACTRKSE